MEFLGFPEGVVDWEVKLVRTEGMEGLLGALGGVAFSLDCLVGLGSVVTFRKLLPLFPEGMWRG